MLQKVAVCDVVDLSAVFQEIHNAIVDRGQQGSIKGVCENVHYLNGMVAMTNEDGVQELGLKERGNVVSTFAKMESDGLVIPAGTLDMDAVHDYLNVYQQKLGL